MSFFQKSVQKNHLRRINQPAVKEAWAKFEAHFLDKSIQENIRSSKEEQYQEGFLDDFFVKILGYTKNPASEYNLTTEFKNTGDSKKADGAILKDGKALAVIELKGTKTGDLKKVQEQAFGYKNNQPDCVYVITSNFEKLRFYIHNAVDYQEFNLFELTFEDFKLMWLCLAKENLLRGLPERIKAESIEEERLITEKFYRQYSGFRTQIFEELIAENPEYDKLTLFKKTQKLLDRFLFTVFAEKRGLLPANSVKNVLKEWTALRTRYNIYQPLYERFKNFFAYIDAGHVNEEYSIFAYNGGLFAPDSILDSVKIGDTVLFNYSNALGEYDYESDISVNILGHIFEHSLTEIEEIQNDLAGLNSDKKKSKRKKDGVFYTPAYITAYIIENTVGKLCKEKRIELQLFEEEYENPVKSKIKELTEKLGAYRAWLLSLKVCDPACGSGAFLNQTLEFFLAEHRFISGLESKLPKPLPAIDELENTVLENNIFGVDINEEAVDIAKLSLWLRTAEYGRKLSVLSNNIKCGNSLTDDPEAGGEKAFNWQKEFPQVFENQGFDVIVGNPPYGAELAEKMKKYLHEKHPLVPDYESYIYFISLYKNILKAGRPLSYIFPNTFLSTIFGTKYREALLKEISVYQIVDLSDDATFHDAAVRTCIFSFIHGQSDEEITLLKIDGDKKFQVFDSYSRQLILENAENILALFSQTKEEQKLIKKLGRHDKLQNFLTVSQGLIPYDKYRGHDEHTIKNRIWHADYQKDKTYKPELKGGDVTAYHLNWNKKLWISYGDWLAAPRNPIFFTSPRILVREITSDRLQSCFTEEEYYNTPSLINIIDQTGHFKLKYVLAVLNSGLMGWYHNKTSPKAGKGLFPKILINDLRNIPLADASESEQEQLVRRTNKITDLNEKYMLLLSDFMFYLQAKLEIEKPSKNLRNWSKLSPTLFFKELIKSKIKLTFEQEADWLSYFKKEKQKAETLRREIKQTEQEIDRMVYQIYRLTPEEIALVESAD